MEMIKNRSFPLHSMVVCSDISHC